MLEFFRGNIVLFIILFLCICAPSLVFGAFQLIAIILLSLFLLAVVGLLIFRWRVTKIVKDMERENMGSESDTLGTKKSRGVSKDVGDYVDFEDIDE